MENFFTKAREIFKKEALEILMKTSVIIAVLVISMSVGFYYLKFLPDKEKNRIEQLQQEKIEQERKETLEKITQQQKEAELAQQKEAERRAAALRAEYQKQLLDSCLNGAYKAYEETWANNCVSVAQKTITGYNNCTASGLLSQSYCRSLWGYPNSSPNCSLPSSISKDLSSYHENLRNECYKRYPQN